MKDVQHIFWFYLFFLLCYHVETRACDRCPCFKRNQKTDNIHNSTAHPYASNTLYTKDYEYKFRVALIYNNDDAYGFFVNAIINDNSDSQNEIVLSNENFTLEKSPDISYKLTLVPITLDEFKNNQDNVLSQYGGLIYLFNIKNKEDLDWANNDLLNLHNDVGSTLNVGNTECSKLAYGIFLIQNKVPKDDKTIIDKYAPGLTVRFPEGSYTRAVVDNDLKAGNINLTTSTLKTFIGILIEKTSNNKVTC